MSGALMTLDQQKTVKQMVSSTADIYEAAIALTMLHLIVEHQFDHDIMIGISAKVTTIAREFEEQRIANGGSVEVSLDKLSHLEGGGEPIEGFDVEDAEVVDDDDDDAPDAPDEPDTPDWAKALSTKRAN